MPPKTFKMLNSAAETAHFIGTDTVSTAGFYASIAWWSAVEKMRPEVDVRYFCAQQGTLKLATPIYLYNPGRVDDAYSANWRLDNALWPASAVAAPWAMAGGCSGQYSGFIMPRSSDFQEAFMTFFPDLVSYVFNENYNFMMKYFNAPTRALIGASLEMTPSQIPLSEAHTVLPVNFTDMDDYSQSLPAKFRSTMRKDRRKFAASGCRIEQTDLKSAMHYLPSLWDNVETKHGAHPRLAFRRDMLTHQVQTLNELSVVFTVRTASNEPIACSLNYCSGSDLVSRLVGLEYDDIKDVGAYFECMYYAAIEYAIEKGCKHIYFGVGSLTAKITRGASIVPLYTFYYGLDGQTMQPDASRSVSRELLSELEDVLSRISRKNFSKPSFMTEN